MLNNNLIFLLFVGSGRTGSTLTGQILNLHPNILITTESRVLQHSFYNNISVKKLLPELKKIAIHEHIHGTRQYDIPGQEKNKLKWQRDWVSTSELSKYDKKDILYIGDKKQGGNIELIIKNRKKVEKLLDVNYIPISVLRSPEQVLASYLRLGKNISEACDILFTNMISGFNFTKEKNGILLKYEFLLNNTEEWCNNVCQILRIENCDKWIKDVKYIVNCDKKNYTLNNKELEYITNRPEYKDLIDKINSI